MNFKDFMDLYDNWNGITQVNDDNLNPIVREKTSNLMWENPVLNGVENKEKLFEMEVVSFGFYDDVFYVRVK